MKKRIERHELIKDVIRSIDIYTQFELVDALKEKKCEVTQASISRDISDMEIKKSNKGTYVLKEDLFLQNMVRDFVAKVSIAENLVVINTSVGTASGVAAALDACKLQEIIGTIAGDDTVLVIVENKSSANSLKEKIEEMI